jgi:hypothetical protein
LLAYKQTFDDAHGFSEYFSYRRCLTLPRTYADCIFSMLMIDETRFLCRAACRTGN